MSLVNQDPICFIGPKNCSTKQRYKNILKSFDKLNQDISNDHGAISSSDSHRLSFSSHSASKEDSNLFICKYKTLLCISKGKNDQ